MPSEWSLSHPSSHLSGWAGACGWQMASGRQFLAVSVLVCVAHVRCTPPSPPPGAHRRRCGCQPGRSASSPLRSASPTTTCGAPCPAPCWCTPRPRRRTAARCRRQWTACATASVCVNAWSAIGFMPAQVRARQPAGRAVPGVPRRCQRPAALPMPAAPPIPAVQAHWGAFGGDQTIKDIGSGLGAVHNWWARRARCGLRSRLLRGRAPAAATQLPAPHTALIPLPPSTCAATCLTTRKGGGAHPFLSALHPMPEQYAPLPLGAAKADRGPGARRAVGRPQDAAAPRVRRQDATPAGATPAPLSCTLLITSPLPSAPCRSTCPAPSESAACSAGLSDAL